MPFCVSSDFHGEEMPMSFPATTSTEGDLCVTDPCGCSGSVARARGGDAWNFRPRVSDFIAIARHAGLQWCAGSRIPFAPVRSCLSIVVGQSADGCGMGLRLLPLKAVMAEYQFGTATLDVLVQAEQLLTENQLSVALKPLERRNAL